MVTPLNSEKICRTLWPKIELITGFRQAPHLNKIRVAYNADKLLKTFMGDTDEVIWNKLRVYAEDAIYADLLDSE